jgi:hypothetical protein
MKKVAYRVPEKECTIVQLIGAHRLPAILYIVLIRRLKGRDVYCHRRVINSDSHWYHVLETQLLLLLLLLTSSTLLFLHCADVSFMLPT